MDLSSEPLTGVPQLLRTQTKQSMVDATKYPTSTESSIAPQPAPSWAASSRPVTLADIQTLLLSFPTKEDMTSFAKYIVEECKQEFAKLQSDVVTLTTRVDTIEQNMTITSATITALQDTIHVQSAHIINLQSHLDDLENRGRRNNLRIRGLPELVVTADLPSTLNHIFNKILGAPPSSVIELDRAHRALRPMDLDPNKPRDVICRVHYYKAKEEILLKSRDSSATMYKGKQLMILPDLSRRTLSMRAALKPLTDALRVRDIPYRWGFPFSLQVRHNGHSARLLTPGDLPEFLKQLNLPQISIPQWFQFFTLSSALEDGGTRRGRDREASASINLPQRVTKRSQRPPQMPRKGP
ncbi:uncharacterized protein [Phyllobates terribilis]|uniref:uncharacterized protein n=1 Tax=Phyllobates terribilis TaxID=111132 RepID=UPI003CCAB4AC